MLAVNPEQATIVKRIFQDYADGVSGKHIAKKLNQEGIPSPRGGKWGVSTLIGAAEKGDGMRIIDDGLWARVKQVQQDTRKRCSGFTDKSGARRMRRPKFILSKPIKCASCGGDYISAGRDRWKCGNFVERGTCGNNRSVSRSSLSAGCLRNCRTAS